jgi:acyl-CoA reductase-like NAD-dependent aldehyde dehydrogenase
LTRTFQTISPVDGSVYVERAYADANAIERALSSAAAAQQLWKNTSVADRAALCRKVVRYFTDHASAIAEEITWQMGRPVRYSPLEIKGFEERATYMIDKADTALEDVKIPDKEGFTRFIRKEPLGTVLVLAPWNYPYLTSVNAVIPALMAGNTVILKHAHQTPLCAERYAEAMQYAGMPEGVFQYLHLTHDQVRDVIGDTRIAHVAFTGSVGGGKAVQAAVNQRFISAGLELGGKDPAYVCMDADLQYSIAQLVDGVCFNSGQSCCGIERIYVHSSLFDDFVQGFVDTVRQYVLGNPTLQDTTLGPMASVSGAQSVVRQIEEAVNKGAKALIRPEDFSGHTLPYLPPQVLVDVDHSMDLMREENFGPVVGIMAVAGDEEALALMNDSPYGLTASVWTRDTDRAIALGASIDTGTCFMNRCDYLDPALAWTGVKDSGMGCTLSALGYDHLTRPKSFHLKFGV